MFAMDVRAHGSGRTESQTLGGVVTTAAPNGPADRPRPMWPRLDPHGLAGTEPDEWRHRQALEAKTKGWQSIQWMTC